MKTLKLLGSFLLALTIALGAVSCKDDDKEKEEPLPKVMSLDGQEKSLTHAYYYYINHITPTRTLIRLSSYESVPYVIKLNQYMIEMDFPAAWEGAGGARLTSISDCKIRLLANGVEYDIPDELPNGNRITSGTFTAQRTGYDNYRISVSMSLRLYNETTEQYGAVPLNFSYEGYLKWEKRISSYEDPEKELDPGELR